MLFREIDAHKKGPFILLLLSNIFFSFDDDNTDDNDEYSEQETRSNREL